MGYKNELESDNHKTIQDLHSHCFKVYLFFTKLYIICN